MDPVVIALLVVLVVLVGAYMTCRLDPFLSAKYQKCAHQTFVGAMAQHPHLVPCAFPTSSHWQMNRCNYA